ncbi:MAG: ATP-binding protein [Endomicrobium sp.]|jgi:predicted AAA+ superfamily ATPase|nr:ATP-binding protein [Endomicrobium sp.]
MSIISKENILKVLNAFNPWWKTGAIYKGFAKTYKRLSYYETLKRLDQTNLRRALILSGARRVGKTTIQYQLIETLLNRGVAPQKIIYISLDHPILKLSGFDEILDCYHSNIFAGKDAYYFFDEIQYASNWDSWLKTIYDMNQEISIVATGSASPALVKADSESGVGRWSVIQIPTLSFYEYCKLIGLDDIELASDIKPSSLCNLQKQEISSIMLKLSAVQNHFIRYLQVGGFPEMALSENDILAAQITREDVVDKVLKRDLPSLYKIRNSIELERIFLYLCNVSSNIVSVETISKELNGVSRPTVENYIKYLESANLIYVSYPVEMSGKKILKARPKIYIADAAIRNSVLMDEDLITNPAEMGKMVETAAYKHIFSFYYQKAAKVGYWRAGGKDKEIDIVVDYPSIKNILIEVKYREDAAINSNDEIMKFAPNASAAFVITKRADDYGVIEFSNGKKLLRIPAFAFLYLLGHAEKNGYRGA